MPTMVCFDPASKRLAVTGLTEKGVIEIHSLDEAERVNTLNVPAHVYELAWHPAGRRLAAGGDDGRIYVVDTQSPHAEPIVLAGHAGQVVTLAFHPEGECLASGSWDGTLLLWDWRTGRRLVRTPLPDARQLQFSPDGRFLGPGRDGSTAWLWEIATTGQARALADLDGPVSATWCINFLDDCGLLVTAGLEGLRIDALSSGHQYEVPAIPGIDSAVLHPDGTCLFTGGMWGLQRWPVRREDGDTLAIGPPEPFGLPAGLPTGRVCLAPDGRTLAVALDWNTGTAVVLDLNQPDRQVQIAAHPGLERLAISADSRWLATGTWHGTGVKIWSTSTGELEAELAVEGTADVLFSPDGRWLVTGSGTAYQLWETGSWKAGPEIERIAAFGQPGKIAFSPSGATLAVARSRTLVQLLDAATLETLGSFEAPEPANVASLAFSHDGAQLVVTHNSRLIQLWNLRSIRDELRRMGLDWPGDPISPESLAPPEPPKRVLLHLPPWLEQIKRGDTALDAGNIEEALASYAAAIDAGIRTPTHWARYALLSLVAGREDDYRTTCHKLREHFSVPLPRHLANQIAWIGALADGGSGDLRSAVALARSAVRNDRDHPALNTLGAVLYRAGDFNEAYEALQQSLVAHGSGGEPFDWIFLAMVSHQLGRHSEAQSWIEKAARERERAEPPDPWLGLEFEVLWKEASTLLDVSHETKSRLEQTR